MIDFVPMDEFHIPLIREWLSGGEALRWYGRDEPRSEADLRRKYLVEKPAGATCSFIIQRAGEPIGYIQYYRATDQPQWYSLVSGKPGDYGLDLFIGRDEFIGHGIGAQVITAALRDFVFSNSDATRCILGPSPDNARAIRCYEKCGFRHLRTVTTDSGDKEYIMAIDRPDILLHYKPSQKKDRAY